MFWSTSSNVQCKPYQTSFWIVKEKNHGWINGYLIGKFVHEDQQQTTTLILQFTDTQLSYNSRNKYHKKSYVSMTQSHKLFVPKTRGSW